MYGLCDCNNFFVSCERVFRPELNKRPVIVLSNNDGCVIARSNEAKRLGIRMGQPLFQIRQLVEQQRVCVFSSNHTLYGDMSRRVIHTLRQLVPAAEIYSIDEAFLDLNGIPIQQLDELGHRISRIVQRNTGIPVSIGMAPTKTLAKIASKLCKHYPALHGACLMYRPQDIETVLRRFPIEEVWGIGRKHRFLLQNNGIRTAWEFTQRPASWIRSRMSITGLRTWKELQGEACFDFENTPKSRQQISMSRSFAHELTDFEELHTSVSNFTVQCAEKLRSQQSLCTEIKVYIFTNRHRDDQPQYFESETQRPASATDDTLELVSLASQILHRIYRKGYGYKKAGVVFSEIVARDGVQRNLFDPKDRTRLDRLMKTLDQINGRLGRNRVIVASQGLIPLKMNREHLSPNYTSDWNDIITVKV